jgi:uncharacterized membrane protein (UPF0127 family)
MLRVENLTCGVTLIEHGRIADRFWTRFKGLIGVQYLALGDGLLIMPANQIHTCFMRIPIDVIYVGAGAKIIGIDNRLKPWRIGRRRSATEYVIELPDGTAARTGSQVGDKLRIESQT